MDDDDDDDDDEFIDDEVLMTEHCEPVSGWNDSWSVMEEMIVAHERRSCRRYPLLSAEWEC